MTRGGPESSIRLSGSRSAGRGPCESDARDVLMAGAVAAGVLVASITELLSLVRGLTPVALATAWGLVLIGVGFAARGRTDHSMPRPLRALRQLGCSFDLVMLTWIAVVVIATWTIAVFAVPITVDSMTYHLARVAY
jgi:hypothetical protein